MAISRAAYYRSVLDQVLAAARIGADQKHLPPDTLRQAIEALPADRRLTVGVADFWLDLGPHLGRKRRQDRAVHNPFYPDGKKMVAAKSEVAFWDDQWRKQVAAKHLEHARTDDGQAFYDELTSNPCPWMIGWIDGREVVIGSAAWLPSSLPEAAFENQPEGYDVRWLRPSAALRLPWRDREDASLWLTIVRTCHRLEEAELERLRKDLDTDPAEGAGLPGIRL